MFANYQTYSQTVYKTPSGKKYHLATCKSVENVSSQLNISEAIAIGLEPCKICKPPSIDTKIKLAPNIPRGENNTQQCKGLTKKGIRCKHMTSLGNGYCFQHNPDRPI